MEPGPRDDDHLDPLALDAVRAGEGTPQDLAHLERCAACRAALEGLRAAAAALRAEAAALRARLGPVPPEVDRAVLDAARRSLSRPRIVRLSAPARAAAAAALALGLLAGLWLALRPRDGDRTEVASRLPAADARIDVDGDGQVDILDAYALASRLEGSSPGEIRDLDGDGRTDREDVALVARESVSLARWRGP